MSNRVQARHAPNAAATVTDLDAAWSVMRVVKNANEASFDADAASLRERWQSGHTPSKVPNRAPSRAPGRVAPQPHPMAVAKAQRDRARGEAAQHSMSDDARDTFRTPVKQLGQTGGHQHASLPSQLDIDLSDDDTLLDASQPYTVHLYNKGVPPPHAVISGESPFPQAGGSMPKQAAHHQSWQGVGLEQTAPRQFARQQQSSLAAGRLQSRPPAARPVQRGHLASSQLQLRTPARPNSAGSALRGYVPPEHRYCTPCSAHVVMHCMFDCTC